MNKNSIILINPKSSGADKIIDFFNDQNINYMIINNKDSLRHILEREIERGYSDYILCGGDGTISNFINQYMGLPENIRSKISVGFFPGGAANDLSRELDISSDIEEAYKQIMQRKIKKIDIIQVNNKYFITGGGFGVTADIVNDVNLLYAILANPLIKKIKRHLYFFSIAKKLIFGFRTTKNPIINGKMMLGRFVGTFIQNQPKTGKDFLISPNSKNNDGICEIFMAKGSKNMFTNIHLLYIFSMGKHMNHKRCIKISFKRISFRLRWRTYFMGDGEILDCSRIFNLKVIHKAISVYYGGKR
jgi:diacylglycerol kinase family enzyme